MNTNIKHYAPVVLRIGLAIVIMWFGLSELIHPIVWTSYIPNWLANLTHLQLMTLVTVNGFVEVALSLLLAFGILTRWVALLLFLHMVAIVGDVGLSALGMRDVAIAFGLLSVSMHGGDSATIDSSSE